MLRVAISNDGKRELVHVPRNSIAQRHRDEFIMHVVTLFLHDNARPHSVFNNGLLYQNISKVLPWLFKSLVLYPIQNLCWDQLDKRSASFNPRFTPFINSDKCCSGDAQHFQQREVHVVIFSVNSNVTESTSNCDQLIVIHQYGMKRWTVLFSVKNFQCKYLYN